MCVQELGISDIDEQEWGLFESINFTAVSKG